MRTIPIVLCTVLATAHAQQKEFHGTVVDGKGQPVANSPVDTYWAVKDGKLVPRAGTRTDAEGRFKLAVDTIPKRPHPLMAIDPTVSFGVAIALDAEHAGDELRLQLVPMVPVRGEITSTNLGMPIERCFVSISHDKAILGLVGVDCPGKFALQLPPGDYRTAYHANDCIAKKGTATVVAGAPELDLGTIDLAPTVLSQHYGKAPPAWTVTDARGVDKAVQLADYKGKWVLLEFWGFW